MNSFENLPNRIIENEKYKIYDDHVYEIVVDAMAEFSHLSKNEKRKIKRYKKLPAEAVFIFKKLEENNIDINNAPGELLKNALKQSFKLLDRNNEYDQDLMNNVGQLETLRWRAGDEQKDESSFQKIVSTLKEHAVSKTPTTKIGQKPRVKFEPKGEYHKKESLS